VHLASELWSRVQRQESYTLAPYRRNSVTEASYRTVTLLVEQCSDEYDTAIVNHSPHLYNS